MAFTSNHANASRSLWARLETGWSLAGTAFLCVVIACLQSLVACAAALLTGTFLLLAALPSPRLILRRFFGINLFVLFMWLFVPWATPGDNLWDWRGIHITFQGVHLCAILTLKANAILAVFLAFLGQTSALDMARGLAALHCPDKLTWILLLMQRNIYLLTREWRKMMDAAKLRGFSASASRHGYATMAVLLGLLFVHAQERGQKLNEALLLAGFNGKLPFRYTLHFSIRAMGFCILIIALSALLILINHV